MTTRTSIEIRTIHGEDLHNLLRDESARTEYAPLRIRGEIPDGKAPIICVEGARLGATTLPTWWCVGVRTAWPAAPSRVPRTGLRR